MAAAALAELPRQLQTRSGEERRSGLRYRLERGGEAEETAMESRGEYVPCLGTGRRRLPRQIPGFFLRNMAVRVRDECPDRVKRAIECECTQMPCHRFGKSCRCANEAIVLQRRLRRGRHDPIAIALDHAQNSVRQ